MARQARIVVPGAAHHVTQRGNNRQDIFFVEGGRRTYLSYLKQSADKYGLAVSAYCLMTNHVHLIVIPEREESLAKALGRTHLKVATVEVVKKWWGSRKAGTDPLFRQTAGEKARQSLFFAHLSCRV